MQDIKKIEPCDNVNVNGCKEACVIERAQKHMENCRKNGFKNCLDFCRNNLSRILILFK